MTLFKEASEIVTTELIKRRPADRVEFLHAVIAHATAGLAAIQGRQRTAEDMYRMADKVVTMDGIKKE